MTVQLLGVRGHPALAALTLEPPQSQHSALRLPSPLPRTRAIEEQQSRSGRSGRCVWHIPPTKLAVSPAAAGNAGRARAPCTTWLRCPAFASSSWDVCAVGRLVGASLSPSHQEVGERRTNLATWSLTQLHVTPLRSNGIPACSTAGPSSRPPWTPRPWRSSVTTTVRTTQRCAAPVLRSGTDFASPLQARWRP